MSSQIKTIASRAIKSGNLPPILRPSLLCRQKVGNEQRLKRVTESLEPHKYGIKLQNESELIKCFYPTKSANLQLPNGETRSNKQLELLGRQLLLLSLNQTFLDLFKKSGQDISGFDFNYGVKMEHMSSWKKNSQELVRRFLKSESLTNLARLSAPRNRIPDRIQYTFDQRAFSAIIGYLSVTNDLPIVNLFLKKKIASPIARTILR